MRAFVITAIIGFILPFLFFMLLKVPNDNLKIFILYALPKFNIIYFIILIGLFFAGLKKEILRKILIQFVVLFFIYLGVDFYFISKIYAKKHMSKTSKIVALSELKNIKNFKLIYKRGNWAVIEIVKRDKTLPFNYKKDRR